ncbi:MAG TPA: SRPBCC family protein [Acidimicrobiia bacterium]|nr:SRPBCC family protein [Acidimicrobiia bacterium]
MSLLSYTVEEVIDRSPVEVFDFCSDLRNEQVWNPTLEYVEKLTRGPVGMGTRYAAKWSNSGRIVVEVVGFNAPLMWETRSRAGGLMVTVQGRLSDLAPGTRYQTTVEVEARGAARLYAPLAVIAMRRREPENFHHIKNTLEAGASRSP